MAEKRPAGKPGRKAPEGTQKQLSSSMDPAVIRAIKVATAELDKSASHVPEEAAAEEWLGRYRASKR